MRAFVLVLNFVLIVSSSLLSPPGDVSITSCSDQSHALLSLLRGLLIFLEAQSNCGPMLYGLSAVGELVEWRGYWGGFQSLQIGIDRNQSFVTSTRGLGEL